MLTLTGIFLNLLVAVVVRSATGPQWVYFNGGEYGECETICPNALGSDWDEYEFNTNEDFVQGICAVSYQNQLWTGFHAGSAGLQRICLTPLTDLNDGSTFYYDYYCWCRHSSLSIAHVAIGSDEVDSPFVCKSICAQNGWDNTISEATDACTNDRYVGYFVEKSNGKYGCLQGFDFGSPTYLSDIKCICHDGETSAPTLSPNRSPSTQPTESPVTTEPSLGPTARPSAAPSRPPSRLPTRLPSKSPTSSPSRSTSASPTPSPVVAPFILDCNVHKPWNEANQYCQDTFNTTLATVSNEAEFTQLWSQISDTSTHCYDYFGWIGLRYDANNTWADATVSSYHVNDSISVNYFGNPNAELCLQVSVSSGWRWMPCNWYHRIVCNPQPAT